MYRIFFLFFLSFWTICNAQNELQYTLTWDDPTSHLYQITLKTQPETGNTTLFRIPAWRPGRYIIQNYAAGVSDFVAENEKGKELQWKKKDNHSWEVQNPEKGKITIRYRFYANVMDAGSSFLGTDEAYFNGANLFMYVQDQIDWPCTLDVKGLPKTWKAATALTKTERHNVFTAGSYHDFIDSPTILSPTLKTLSRRIEGTKFYFHFQGNFTGGTETEETLIQNAGKIITEQTRIFGELPAEEYHFIYILLPYNMRHAVEHKNSACFTLPEKNFASARALSGIYNITAHEFFHFWNVKRLRPAALWPYDYSGPQYTTLHWFTEGVTDYYAAITTVRSGLRDKEKFLSGLGKMAGRLEDNYAAQHVSPAKSSHDSWLSGSQYADPHLGTSYYGLGYRVGLFLDLEIRMKTNGEKSLDELMDYLYQTYFKADKGLPENGVLEGVKAVTGMEFDDFFRDHVEGVEPYDLEQYFNAIGMDLSVEDGELTGDKLVGIESMEPTSYGIYLKRVRPDGDLAQAGVGDGDLILTINGKGLEEVDAKEVFEKWKTGDKVKMKVFSNGTSRDIVLKVQGKNAPKDYVLTPKPDPSDAQKKLLEEWLAPRKG